MSNLSEQDFAAALYTLVQSAAYGEAECDEDELFKDASVDSFEAMGVLTRNEGLVIRLADGSEFQVTVVRSR